MDHPVELTASKIYITSQYELFSVSRHSKLYHFKDKMFYARARACFDKPAYEGYANTIMFTLYCRRRYTYHTQV
jgi:hypothetical protein